MKHQSMSTKIESTPIDTNFVLGVMDIDELDYHSLTTFFSLCIECPGCSPLFFFLLTWQVEVVRQALGVGSYQADRQYSLLASI